MVRLLVAIGVRYAGAAGPASHAYFGVIAWDAESSLAGTGPLVDPPDPSNGALDWMIRIPIVHPANVPTGTIANNVSSEWVTSRAMRRLGNTKGLLGVFQAQSGTFGFNVDVRYAIKE